jgi:integrase
MADISAITPWARVAKLPINLEHIQDMGKGPLLALQRHLGLGGEWGVLRAPQAWLTPGTTVVSHGTFRLTKETIQNASSDTELDLAKSVYTRHILLLLLIPSVGSEGARKYMSLRTVWQAASVIQKHQIAPALLIKPTTPGKLLSRLGAPAGIASGKKLAGRQNRALLSEIRRLRVFASRNLWSDLPEEEVGIKVELSRKFVAPPVNDPPNVGAHHPFSDEFISEAGWRVAWIAENLSASITAAAEEAHWIALNLGRKCTQSKLDNRTRKFLATFSFQKRDGSVIEKLPFEVQGTSKHKAPLWPPTRHAHIFAFLEMIQAAHLFIVLLSTGGRISEVMSLREDCLREADDPDSPTLATGRTFKLVFSHEGQERDWPLPELAIVAIKNQIRIVALYEKVDGPRSLWCSFAKGSEGQPLHTNYRRNLAALIKWLGLQSLLGDQNMRSHRFRKTIARLVALAIVESPKVLMDIFGHKSIAMTMRYILTDPLIRSEMDTIRRELVIMFASKAIEGAETNGGPAAVPLREAVRNAQVRTGSEWGQDDIRELAFTLTANGQQWSLVRPGVLCTKQANQAGPCTANKSTPDPSRCRAHCPHRLEDASAREEANRSIEQAIEFAEAAIIADNDLEKELWMGQILSHLDRFPDVRAMWEAHPLVMPALAPRLEEA